MLNLEPGDIFGEHYRLVRLIDTGGFTDVWEAIFLSAGNTVALKIYPRLDAEGVQNIEDEYKNQAELSHTNLLIARYFGRHNGYPYLEMRYCSDGNASAKIGNCTEAEVARCMYNVGSALAYLHDNSIVHQDVKPNNFLLDKAGNFYLADLGLSLRVRNTIKRFTQSKSINSSYIAGITPPPYRAPELYDRSSIGMQPVKATDIWAFGASLFELITGNEPFGEFGGLNQHKSPEVPDLPTTYSSQLNAIIKKCLSKETWDRPKASEIAEWGRHYLSKGNFGYEEKEPAPAIVPNVSSVSNEPPPTVVNKTELPPASKRSVLPWLIGAAVLIIALGAGIVFWLTYKTSEKYVPNNTVAVTGPTDSNSTRKKDTSYAALKDTSVKIEDPKMKKIGEFKTTDSIKSPKIGEISPQAGTFGTMPVVTYNPHSETPPKNSFIKIAKIERGTDNLKVYFTLQRPADDVDNSSTFTIYGPEKEENCFYVEADGTDYDLISIYPKGEKLSFGSGKVFQFTATFKKIPANVKIINLVEGRDRDWNGQNYWTFKKVHIQ